MIKKLAASLFYALAIPPFLLAATLVWVGPAQPTMFYLQLNEKIADAINRHLGPQRLRCSLQANTGPIQVEEQVADGPWKPLSAPYDLADNAAYRFSPLDTVPVVVKCDDLTLTFYRKPVVLRLASARFTPPVLQIERGELSLASPSLFGIRSHDATSIYLRGLDIAVTAQSAPDGYLVFNRCLKLVHFSSDVFVVKPSIAHIAPRISFRCYLPEGKLYSSDFNQQVSKELIQFFF